VLERKWVRFWGDGAALRDSVLGRKDSDAGAMGRGIVEIAEVFCPVE
jgi:hypothetical protein